MIKILHLSPYAKADGFYRCVVCDKTSNDDPGIDAWASSPSSIDRLIALQGMVVEYVRCDTPEAEVVEVMGS